jgi:hypothetical protein
LRELLGLLTSFSVISVILLSWIAGPRRGRNLDAKIHHRDSRGGEGGAEDVTAADRPMGSLARKLSPTAK